MKPPPETWMLLCLVSSGVKWWNKGSLLSVPLASKTVVAEATQEACGIVFPCSVEELERPQGHFTGDKTAVMLGWLHLHLHSFVRLQRGLECWFVASVFSLCEEIQQLRQRWGERGAEGEVIKDVVGIRAEEETKAEDTLVSETFLPKFVVSVDLVEAAIF